MREENMGKFNILIAEKAEMADVLRIKKEAHSLYVENRPDIYRDSDVMYTDDFIHGYFDHDDKMVLIAKSEEDEVAAYFLVQVIDVDLPMMKERRYLYIHDLAVLTRFRQNGIATEMLSYVADYARKIGATKIELAVHLFNTDALRLYEQNGFRPRAVRMERDV